MYTAVALLTALLWPINCRGAFSLRQLRWPSLVDVTLLVFSSVGEPHVLRRNRTDFNQCSLHISTSRTDFFSYILSTSNIANNRRILLTRNTFCGTWYLPHSHVHNERTVPIIMAGCMAHEREGYISTSGPKSDVIIDFLYDAGISAIRP